LKMETAGFSETLVAIYQTTWRYGCLEAAARCGEVRPACVTRRKIEEKWENPD
jgi:hypothetical protein